MTGNTARRKPAHGLAWGAERWCSLSRCPELRDPERTLLGAEQEAWLLEALGTSSARWNVLAQQTLMAQHRLATRPRASLLDRWLGWLSCGAISPAQLHRRQRPANPLVIGGDVHSYWVSDLKPNFDDPQSPVVATEFCGTSITSQGPPQERVDASRADNPHIKFAHSEKRGYVCLEITPERCEARLRALDNEKKRASRVATLAAFVVENGRPGVMTA